MTNRQLQSRSTGSKLKPRIMGSLLQTMSQPISPTLILINRKSLNLSTQSFHRSQLNLAGRITWLLGGLEAKLANFRMDISSQVSDLVMDRTAEACGTHCSIEAKHPNNHYLKSLIRITPPKRPSNSTTIKRRRSLP